MCFHSGLELCILLWKNKKLEREEHLRFPEFFRQVLMHCSLAVFQMLFQNFQRVVQHLYQEAAIGISSLIKRETAFPHPTAMVSLGFMTEIK